MGARSANEGRRNEAARQGGLTDAACIVAEAGVPAVATTLDGAITDWNDRCADLLGHAASAVIGRDLLDLTRPTDVFDNDYGTPTATLAEQMLAGRGVRSFELELVARDGTRVRVELSLIVVAHSEPGDSRVVHLLLPRRRRRRADWAPEPAGETEKGHRGPRRRGTDPRPTLSVRQREVLRLLVDGHNGPAIARRLGISTHTVRNHIQAIYHQLGVTTRAAAVAQALATRLG